MIPHRVKQVLCCCCAAAGMLGMPGIEALAQGGERSIPRHELRKMFPGQFQARVKGFDVRFIASGDGRLKGFYGSLTDTGRWSVRGNRLCITLKDWLDGETKCAAVRRASHGPWYLAGNIRFRRM